MEKNIPEREDLDEVEITLDFEDAIVQPVDGVIIQGDDEEIKLLFFYVKPESNHDEEGIAQCKCVAEFRKKAENGENQYKIMCHGKRKKENLFYGL